MENNEEKVLKNIKLTIAYDGTKYHGWQSQINALAIQDIMENAMKELTGEDCSLTGSSRTDVGVHALGQSANFFTESRIPAEKFAYAINQLLPRDIIVTHSEEVAPDFHARYSCKGKRYRYLIYNERFPSAILQNRACHVSKQLDFDSMQLCTGFLVGKHDFSSFKSTGSSVRSDERTIYEATLVQYGKNYVPFSNIIAFDISGDGFLYNMVRIIAGTLIDVGLGKIKAEEMPSIIQACDRKKAGKTAPSHGLYLVEVFY
jgi:tRNA pseudouridine38-40 synthase